MNIIIILIVIVIIYLFLKCTKVVHVDTLPPDKQKELNNKSKMRSLLLQNHIKNINNVEAFSPTMSTDNINIKDKSNYKSSFPLSLIKSRYLDNIYQFNIANLPVTRRYLSESPKRIDREYMIKIKMHINHMFTNCLHHNHRIDLHTIQPYFILETEYDFIIKVAVDLTYHRKNINLLITYYGTIEQTDDILNGTSYVNKLQMIDIITTKYLPQISNIKYNPFITMEEQLQYVKKINDLHVNESYE